MKRFWCPKWPPGTCKIELSLQRASPAARAKPAGWCCWLEKGPNHRGVKLLSGAQALLGARGAAGAARAADGTKKNRMVTEYIHPYTVDGFKFDVGLYTFARRKVPRNTWLQRKRCVCTAHSYGLDSSLSLRVYLQKK